MNLAQKKKKKDDFTHGMPIFEGENKLCKGFQRSPISTTSRLVDGLYRRLHAVEYGSKTGHWEQKWEQNRPQPRIPLSTQGYERGERFSPHLRVAPWLILQAKLCEKRDKGEQCWAG